MVKRIGLDLQATGAGAKALMRESATLYGELARTLLGSSAREVPRKTLALPTQRGATTWRTGASLRATLRSATPSTGRRGPAPSGANASGRASWEAC